MRELETFFRDGGPVMIPLAGLALVMCYGLGYRLVLLGWWARRSERAGLWIEARRRAAGRHLRRQVLAEVWHDLESELGGLRGMVSASVRAAPLLGLLGTVTGMIETFASLGDSTLLSQGGGIAGGISEALITTQMGLVIAVPGLVLGRLLDRREDRIRTDLQQLGERLMASSAREVVS